MANPEAPRPPEKKRSIPHLIGSVALGIVTLGFLSHIGLFGHHKK